jgi:hypothetical protein
MDPFVHDFIINEDPDHESSRFAQVSAEPAPPTPDSNRATFDAAVAHADKVVNTEHSSEADRTSTHATAMANQQRQTFDKNAATRTKYNVEEVENNVAHRQWVTRNNRNNWAQVSAPEAPAVTPDSNRATFDAAVAHADKVVNTEHSSEADRTSTHATAMANQQRQTFDKNAATRTKYNVEEVENNVAHRQWVTRNNRTNWAQTSAPGDRTINR